MTDPPVSDHAVLRYAERAMGFQMELARRFIAEQCRAAVKVGAASFVVNGVRFEFKNGAVVTVTHDRPDPSRTRRDRLAGK